MIRDRVVSHFADPDNPQPRAVSRGASSSSRRGRRRRPAAERELAARRPASPRGRGRRLRAQRLHPHRHATDRSTLVMPYVEMGQGTYTSMPMLIAEELEVDLSQVRLEHAPPDETLYANPRSACRRPAARPRCAATWTPLREAGAVARTMLVSAAAKRWKVDPASCHAQSGEVLHPPTGRRRQLWRARRRRRPHAGPRKRRAQGAARTSS